MAKVTGTLYTYPDNFRAYKALIAAKYSGASVKTDPKFVFGETNKSKQFLAKFPFGKVPAFEGSDGFCISESNAIAYYLADDTLRGGSSPANRALVQQWMSFADAEVLPSACTWAFPAMGVMKENKGAVEKAKEDLKKAMAYLDQYLLHSTYLAGERITLADISVACTLLLPYRFVCDPQTRKPYPNVNRWFTTVVNQPNVAAVVGSVQLCEKAGGGEGGKGGKGGDKGGKKQEKKKEKKVSEPAEEEEVLALPEMPKKEKDPFAAVPKGNFDFDDFKRFYSNNDEEKSIPYFWEKLDKENYSIWRCDYKYNDELTMVFMSCNLIGGMFQRLEKLRKNAFASVCLFGENNNSTISGIWVWRGHDLAFELSPDWQIDYTSYDWKKLDTNSDETKKLVEQYFKWEGTDLKGRKFNQGKIFK